MTINWFIFISGNVLSHDTDGETALIPAEVMRYSLEKSTEVNIETSLRVLASPGEPNSSILVYFLNHRWRWCRFASSIFKTMQLAMHSLYLNTFWFFSYIEILISIFCLINFQYFWWFYHAFNSLCKCLLNKTKLILMGKAWRK